MARGDKTPMIYAIIGMRIRDIRLGLGIGSGELADRIGMNRSSVSLIESGRRRVQIATLYDIAHVLGVPVSSLMPEQSVQTNKSIGELFKEFLENYTQQTDNQE